MPKYTSLPFFTMFIIHLHATQPETNAATKPTTRGSPAEAPPPLLARAWLPTVAVVLLALGLAGLLLVSSQGFAFIPGAAQQEFVSVPDPASYLSPIYLMLLLVPPIPLALVGPSWSRSHRCIGRWTGSRRGWCCRGASFPTP